MTIIGKCPKCHKQSLTEVNEDILPSYAEIQQHYPRKVLLGLQSSKTLLSDDSY
jgi:cytochrome c553